MTFLWLPSVSQLLSPSAGTGKEVCDLGCGGSHLLEGCLRERGFFNESALEGGEKGGHEEELHHSPVVKEKCYNQRKGFKPLLKLIRTPAVLEEG